MAHRAPGKQREWEDLAGDADEIVVSRVLPGAGEDAVPLLVKERGIRVHASGQCGRDADVGIDLERSLGHRGDAKHR